MISLDKLSHDARTAPSAEAFAAAHPEPVLIREHAAANRERPNSIQTVATSRRDIGLLPTTASQAEPAEQVLLVRKKARGKFAKMITVGRTPSNDVMVEGASVSKFHAYFYSDERGWFIQDANSSNGTYLDGQAVSAESPTALRDGVALQFSPDTRYRFFTAQGLFDFLRAGREAPL